MLVLSAFGLIAVLLAALGVYGVIAQRRGRAPAGNRCANGSRATGRQILGLFLRIGLMAAGGRLREGPRSSVFRRPFCTIDDEHVDATLRRFEFQAQLLS